MRPVPHALYPFAPHWLELAGGVRMHYVDEGEGEPVVMVHGNPTWSFYYRALVKALAPDYRCVVPDHVGMGKSDKPPDERYEYRLRRRVDDLEALLDHLAITRGVTLVVHDWGGMIGMAWAARHVERVARLVIMNTAAFPLPAERPFHWPLKLTRTPLGGVLVKRLNAFAEVAARTCVTRAPMPRAVRKAYTAPYDTPANRVATLRFVQDIPLGPEDPGYRIVEDTERALPRLAHRPAIIFWGEKDFVFDLPFLRRWEHHLPDAEVVRFPDCGHYVLEDATDEIVPRVRRFLDAHPLTST